MGTKRSRLIQEPRASGPLDGTVVILWHGAGGDVDQRHLVALASRLPELGAAVVRARFAYRVAGKRGPDRMPKLMASARETIEAVRASHAPRRLFLGGRSMGGRVASMLAAEGDPMDGLVLLSYPLHPAGKEDRLRDAHLHDIGVPMLFLQGDRDRLCNLDLLRPILAKLSTPTTLEVFAGGDHGMRRVPDEAIVEKTVAWLTA